MVGHLVMWVTVCALALAGCSDPGGEGGALDARPGGPRGGAVDVRTLDAAPGDGAARRTRASATRGRT
ncbi:MAG: hypothetical protein H6704_15320 [Myxococcales bacterium]|nr:hypothetical protein [Myxococcales bacterium]